MIHLPPSPPLDPWASSDDEQTPTNISLPGVERPVGQAGPSRNGPRTLRKSPTPHPLHSHTADLISIGGGDVLGDVSRPALTRLTSETERQVAESSRSGSERGSLDLLRMSTANASANAGGEEVEVLIHKVKPEESMVGIALLYGIEVATLRKINKLWASDSVHLRTHLYVPLEACKWTKARDTFTRGPGDGQVTLTPKDHNRKDKGKSKQDTPKLVDVGSEPRGAGAGDEYDAWEDSAREFMPSTNVSYGRPSLDAGRMSMETDRDRDREVDDGRPESGIRILDIVRIPRSQLQFFPKHKPPDPRKSLDSPLRTVTHSNRRPSDQADGPSIQNDLSTLPSPLQPRFPTPSKSGTITGNGKVVRLRPPVAPTPQNYSAADTLVNRISSLFTVPPPPSSDLFGSRRTSLGSTARSTPGSGNTSPARSVGRQDVSLELRPRSSFEGPPRRNGHHRTASTSKKYD